MRRFLFVLAFVLASSTIFAVPRGDVNGDGLVNVTDPIYMSNFLFQGGPPPPCPEAADINNDGSLNNTDIILLFNALFGGCGGCIAQPTEVDC